MPTMKPGKSAFLPLLPLILLSACGYTIRPMPPNEMPRAEDPMPLKVGLVAEMSDNRFKLGSTSKFSNYLALLKTHIQEFGPKFAGNLSKANVFDGVQFPMGSVERLDLIIRIQSNVIFMPDPHDKTKALSAAVQLSVRDKTGEMIKKYSEQQDVALYGSGGAAWKIDAYVAAYNSAVGNISLKLINDLIQDKALLRGAAANATAAAGGIKRKDLNAAIKQAMAQKKPEEVEIHSDVDRPDYRAAENVNNFALVIGIDKYSNLPEAQFADRDARAMRKHLEALGYPARNIKTLLNGKATKTAMATALDAWLGRAVNMDSTVFFYYSGHGAPDPATGQAYLVPWDGDPQFLNDTAYPLKGLYAKLNSLGAKKIIVALDSCFSGIGGRSVLAKGVRPLVNKVETGAIGDHTIAFAASGGDQISGTIEEQGHGAFTYYFLKGLNGDAKNAAGQVTVQSLYDYLLPKVEDAAGRQSRSQRPQLWSASQEQRAETILR